MKRVLILSTILLIFMTGCVSKRERRYANEIATSFIQNDLGLENTSAEMNKWLADEGGSVRMSILFDDDDLREAQQRYLTDITKDISKKKRKNHIEFKTIVFYESDGEERITSLYSDLTEALNINISDLYGNELLTNTNLDLIELYSLNEKIQYFDYTEVLDIPEGLDGLNIRFFIDPITLKGYKTVAKDYERLIYANTKEKLEWLTKNMEQFQIILIIDTEKGKLDMKPITKENIKIEELKTYSDFSIKFSRNEAFDNRSIGE